MRTRPEVQTFRITMTSKVNGPTNQNGKGDTRYPAGITYPTGTFLGDARYQEKVDMTLKSAPP